MTQAWSVLRKIRGEPASKSSHLPVSGHQAVRQQPDGTAIHRLDHNPLEGGVIFRLGKEFISSVAAIEGVVSYSAGGQACATWHEFRPYNAIDLVKKKVRFLFSSLHPCGLPVIFIDDDANRLQDFDRNASGASFLEPPGRGAVRGRSEDAQARGRDT